MLQTKTHVLHHSKDRQIHSSTKVDLLPNIHQADLGEFGTGCHSLGKDHGFSWPGRPVLTQHLFRRSIIQQNSDTSHLTHVNICHSKRPSPSLPSLPSLPLPSHFLWSGNNYGAINFGIFKICHNGQMPQCSFSGGHGGKGPPVANCGPSKRVTTAKPAVYQHKRNRKICIDNINSFYLTHVYSALLVRKNNHGRLSTVRVLSFVESSGVVAGQPTPPNVPPSEIRVYIYNKTLLRETNG